MDALPFKAPLVIKLKSLGLFELKPSGNIPDKPSKSSQKTALPAQPEPELLEDELLELDEEEELLEDELLELDEELELELEEEFDEELDDDEDEELELLDPEGLV